MKKGLLLSVLAMASLAVAAEVVFDGQVRYRMENASYTPMTGPNFDSDIDAFNHTFLRTRLGVKATPQEGLTIYIQAQDSRHIGGGVAVVDSIDTNDDGMNDAIGRDVRFNSATNNNDSNLGLHQAYLTWDCKLASGLTILAGRFEYSKADERFFGKADWNNVGRVHDGWALIYKTPFTTIDLFGVKAMESEVAKRDITDFGIYFNNILGKRIDLFYNSLDFGQDATEKKNALNTVGVHYDNTYFNKLGVNFNFATQMGTNEQADLDHNGVAADADYSGMMYGVDLSYQVSLPVLDKVGFGYESLSGQDNSSDLTSWFELFPAGHKFHGYMDIVGKGDIFGYDPMMGKASDVAGLNDIQVNFMGQLPVVALDWKLDYHVFSSVEKFTNHAIADGATFDVAEDTTIGSEIDLSLGKRMDNFGVNLGYSLFTPEANFASLAANKVGDSQSWMYLMFTAGF